MSYLNQPDYVRYVCSCGSLKPISQTYFCRHCSKIRCGYCNCQEIDTYYCPNCLENSTFVEARLEKNKCSNCFECPCCFHTLSTRAGHIPFKTAPPEGGESKDAKTPPKKFYYLFCSMCRWTSRDAGIPDQTIATGGWPEQENPHVGRINTLIEYHKILASIEKLEWEKNIRPKCPSVDAYAIIPLSLKRIVYPTYTASKYQSSDQPPPSIASENVEELPANIFTDPVDITKITTLEQRLQHLEMQVENMNELRPQRRKYLVKRSERCRACEHSVSKPDLCAQSTKFKIQLAAYYHVPEVRIVTCEPLRSGETSELLLKFCNPTQHQTQITLLPLDAPMSPIEITSKEGDVKEENVQQDSESPNLLPSIVQQIPITEDTKPIKVTINADVLLPQASIILAPRDDAAEYDDTGDTYDLQDDPKHIVWRKGNKTVIKIYITPHNSLEEHKENEPIIIGFVMQYEHVNTITTLENKASKKLDLKVKLYLTVGNIVGNA
ncbi:dynactin subunit 4 isoform X1 [Megalopta genalis]|uniref:dynactin subunit 4 isoform X1 n=1 Tax=Megalopta genalis TaxID=115081 RepID=UPI003FD56DCE